MDWIPVGNFTRTHGLKGELKFRPYVTDREILQSMRHARIVDDEEKESDHLLERVRNQGAKWIIKIKGCNSIEDAEAYIGHTVQVALSDFPALPEGEYYWFEIIGLKVFDDTGQYHGSITRIIATGSNDVYVVEEGKRELLLPMIDSVVQEINLEERKLVFHPVEGLLEDDSL